MTIDELANQALALAAKATPGPWAYGPNEDETWILAPDPKYPDDGGFIVADLKEPLSDADYALVVFARAHVEELARAVLALRKENERLIAHETTRATCCIENETAVEELKSRLATQDALAVEALAHFVGKIAALDHEYKQQNRTLKSHVEALQTEVREKVTELDRLAIENVKLANIKGRIPDIERTELASLACAPFDVVPHREIEALRKVEQAARDVSYALRVMDIAIPNFVAAGTAGVLELNGALAALDSADREREVGR